MQAVAMPNVVALQVPSSNPLAFLQDRFALVNVGGPIYVIQLSDLVYKPGMPTAPPLKLLKREDAKILMMRELQNINSSVQPKSVINAFFDSPNTKLFNRLAFTPRPVPQDVLNLWEGPTISLKPGPWRSISRFLRDVVCGGDPPTYMYLLSYIAHMLQKPEEKPGILIFLRGGQGIGKGTFFRLIHRIWGATTWQVNRVEHVTEGFNSCLERSFAVLLDEALFAGDNKSADALKSIVTEPLIGIEEKYQPRRMVQSLHRFFAATNSEHIGKVELDDRRIVIITVSESRKGDHTYWRRVHAAIDGAEAEAFAYEMLRRDIRKFDPRVRPKRPELIDQKIRSLQGLERWWFERLSQGLIPEVGGGFGMTYGDRDWVGSEFVSTDSLLGSFQKFNRGARLHQPATSNELSSTLRKLCKSAVSDRQSVGGTMKRGHILPSLTQARKDFEGALGGVVGWPP
jgi:hypothetical protein